MRNIFLGKNKENLLLLSRDFAESIKNNFYILPSKPRRYHSQIYKRIKCIFLLKNTFHGK